MNNVTFYEPRGDYNSSNKELINNPILVDFYKSKKNNSTSYVKNFASIINHYLKWRQITIEELIELGINESPFLTQFINDNSLDSKKRTRETIVSSVRQLMRFHKIPIVAERKRKDKIWYYDEDDTMNDFLDLHIHSSDSTKKKINRAIKDYCEFREKTPTELIEEQIDVKIIKKHLRGFFKWKKENFRATKGQEEISNQYIWQIILIIKRFYEEFFELHFVFKEYEKPTIDRTPKRQETITKDEMRELLAIADVRDSMILYGLWESGLSPVDLTSITYGKIKQFLNIGNPEDVPECAAFWHQRQKTKRKNSRFVCVLGKQTLKYVSMWLQLRTKNARYGYFEKITDDSIIFSTKSMPFKRSKHVPMNCLYNICKQLDTDTITPGRFRNNFNTRLTEAGLDYLIREMFMGHSLGIAGHYTHLQLDFYIKEYLKHYPRCFDLTIEDEKYKELEEENLQIKDAIRDIGSVLEGLIFEVGILSTGVQEADEWSGESNEALIKLKEEQNRNLQKVLETTKNKIDKLKRMG